MIVREQKGCTYESGAMQYIKAIVRGSEIYFRAFALADNMYHHEAAIEWIVPLPGEKGPEHYGVWLEQEVFTFYLGFLDRVPACTAATIKDGTNASLEFVSTSKEHRRKGAAYAVRLKALQYLYKRGVDIVTLRSSFEAYKLYERLGFKPYYEQQLFSFQEA